MWLTPLFSVTLFHSLSRYLQTLQLAHKVPVGRRCSRWRLALALARSTRYQPVRYAGLVAIVVFKATSARPCSPPRLCDTEFQ
jgi:hypothetical protein